MSNAERVKRYRENLRNKARELHGDKCVVCGEPATELAHVYPTGLRGPGRGMDRRYRDAIKNSDCYVATCKKCNKKVEAKL